MSPRPLLIASSLAEAATFAAITGSFDANYPVTDLADPVEPTKVARLTPSGGVGAFSCVLPAAVSVGGLAVVAHTINAAGTVRARFYSDAGLSSLVTGGDIGPTAIPTPVSGYAQTFPVVLPAAQTVRSVRIDLGGLSGAVDIGALMVGEAWEWPFITAGMEAGFSLPDDDVDLEGGGAIGASGVKKRTRSGEVSWMDLSMSATQGLDFQIRNTLARPFVFCEDYGDPTCWPRDCFLAVNEAVPDMVAQMFDADRFQFRFAEWKL